MNFKSLTLVFIVSIIFATQIESKWLAPHGLVFKKMIPVRGTIQLNNRVFTLDAEKGIKSSYVQQVASQEVAKDESKPVSTEPLSDDEPTTVESVSESNPVPVPSPTPTTSTTTTTTTTTTQAPSTLPSTTSTLPSTTSTSTTTTTIATPVQPIRVISKTSPVHPSKGSSGKNNQHHHEQQQQQQQHHHQSSHESSHHHQSSGKISGKTSVKTSSQSSFASPAQRARATRRPTKM